MTVSVQAGYDTYVGNGVTTVFAFTFSIFKKSDMLAELDGVTQILNLDYTIPAIGEGGDVTFITAPGSGVAVTLSGKVPFDRSYDYIANGDFKANEVDTDLDRIVVLCQQLARDFGRSFILPLESLATIDIELPAPIASRFFAWNSGATALEYIDPGSVVLAIPASESVDADKLDSTDLVALRTKLSVSTTADVLLKAGGTMTGKIVLDGDATTALHPVPVQQIQKNTIVYAADSGAADAYVMTLVPAITAYVRGMDFFMDGGSANTTTTPTVNINTLGAKIIKRVGGAALLAGDIPSNHKCHFFYDGTDMILQNPALHDHTSVNQGGILTTINTRINFDGTIGTPLARDEVNISSLDDDSVGTYTANFTNNYTTANFAAVPGVGPTDKIINIFARTTSSVSVVVTNLSGTGIDASYVSILCSGSLA